MFEFPNGDTRFRLLSTSLNNEFYLHQAKPIEVYGFHCLAFECSEKKHRLSIPWFEVKDKENAAFLQNHGIYLEIFHLNSKTSLHGDCFVVRREN